VKLKLQPGRRWRKGDDVFSAHFLTLSEALNLCEIDVPTIESSVKLKVNPHCPKQEYELPGKGVKGAKHVALVSIRVPRGDLDEITSLINSLREEWKVDQ
jgi:DnaJ-class molecular chaperone